MDNRIWWKRSTGEGGDERSKEAQLTVNCKAAADDILLKPELLGI